MDNLKLSKTEKNVFIIFSLLVIFIAVFFNYRSLRGRLAYRQAFGRARPVSVVGRSQYYQDKLSAFKRAIFFLPGKARYYSHYAEAVESVVCDDLGESLGVGKEKAESLYRKAIELNPTNFLHHLSLARFYRKQNDPRAKRKIMEASSLYPTYTGQAIKKELAYLRLAKAEKYLKENKPIGAFKNLALCIYYKRGQRRHHEHINTKSFLEPITEQVNKIEGLELDAEKINLKVTINPLSSDYDLKEEGFPSAQMSLLFRVYLANSDDQVFFCRGFRDCRSFRYEGKKNGFFVYEYFLEDYPESVYLDHFRIQTENFSLLERVEIIKKFRW